MIYWPKNEEQQPKVYTKYEGWKISLKR